MPEDYRLFVNPARTVMVRIWKVEAGEVVEVATRETSAHIWSPPIVLVEET